jgi:hypothetical protein
VRTRIRDTGEREIAECVLLLVEQDVVVTKAWTNTAISRLSIVLYLTAMRAV